MQPFVSRIVEFFKELKRRKLYTAVVAYVALSLVLIEVSDHLIEAFELPGLIKQVFTVVAVLGFPVVVVLSWIFDFGPEGLQRTAEREVEPARRGSSRGAVVPPPALLRGAPPPLTSAPRDAAAPEGDSEPATPPDPDRVRRVTLAHARHELKTPINAIIGYSEMLLDDAADAGDESVRPDLERIRKAGRELLDLVEEILDPARAEEADLESYGARIRADLRNPINAVTGYAEMLTEACRESGAEALIPDLEHIRTAAFQLLDLSNDIVQLGTSDDATGIEGDALRQASTLTEGVLAQIRPVAHRGDELNRQGVLLVVDDNGMNRDLVSRQLARRGYQVATAEHGGQALARLEEQPVDLVLLDVLMPEMDGIETLRRIKAQARLRGVPVIMMSSLDEIDGAIRCLEIGAEDYLTKPIHPTMLDVRIGASLEVRRLREREEFFRTRLEEGDATAKKLLCSVVPTSVAQRMQGGEADIVDLSPQASVLWCELGRAAREGGLPEATERAAALRWLLEVMETEAERAELETMVLVGSAVLLADGVPTPATDHAARLAGVALAVQESLRGATPDGAPLPLRFGLHTGTAAAAVVGSERLAYHVWGDAVDLARRLEVQAGPGQIHVSSAAHALLKDRFTLAGRGVIEVTGRGQMRTFLLTGHAQRMEA